MWRVPVVIVLGVLAFSLTMLGLAAMVLVNAKMLGVVG